jgi:NADH dehydrogenase/NADH:ubiquinone oxidoreductase subunit G
MQGIEAIINGKKIVAEPGMTILQAARANGIHIPTLCDHPVLNLLGPAGCACGSGEEPELLTACSTPLNPGMVVYTIHPRVLEARRAVVELLLVRHPLDCFSSPATQMLLQDVAYELGIKESRFADEATPAGATSSRTPTLLHP